MPMSSSMYRVFFASALAVFCTLVLAVDISVIGLFPGKAVVVLDNSPPKVFSVGDTLGSGIKLVASDSNGATFDLNGKRHTIPVGPHLAQAGSSGTGAGKVVLQADSRGHYSTTAQINDKGSLRVLVDTGATKLALPAKEAARLGIEYKRGTRIAVNTANGIAAAWLVQLDSVRVDGIELREVDALVHESGLDIGLLGMSFLGRLEINNSANQMTLTKR
jgi:aspartyl protease family protein